MAKRGLHSREILDQWFGGITPSVPTIWYLALWRGDPSVGWSGLGEVNGRSYARAPVPNTRAFWGKIAARTSGNLEIIQFPRPGSEWASASDPVTHIGFMDAATGGTMKRFLPLASPRMIQAGQVIIIQKRSLQIKEL